MSAALLARLREAGATLTLAPDGKSITLRTGPKPLSAALLKAAREHRDALRAALASEQAGRSQRPHALELAAERAAIAEYDGGLPRSAAELMGLVVSMPPPAGVRDEVWAEYLDTLARDLDLLRAGRASREERR